MPEQHDHNDADFAASTSAEHESESITAPDDLVAPHHSRHGAPDAASDVGGAVDGTDSPGAEPAGNDADGDDADGDDAIDAAPRDPGSPEAEPAETAEQKAAREREEYMLRLFQAAVVGPEAERIGRVGQVYLDDRTQDPNWVTVKTGLFGTKEFFIPLDEATLEGKHLVVPYSKATVLAAPHTEIDQNLSPAEEDDLYNHYRVPGRTTEPAADQESDDDAAGLTTESAPVADAQAPTVADQDETAQVADSEPILAHEETDAEQADAVDELHVTEAEGHDDVDERLFAPPSLTDDSAESAPGTYAGSAEPSTPDAAEEADWSRKGE